MTQSNKSIYNYNLLSILIFIQNFLHKNVPETIYIVNNLFIFKESQNKFLLTSHNTKLLDGIQFCRPFSTNFLSF